MQPTISLRRRQGATLLHILSITSVFALLSAMVFPRLATPARVAEVGVIAAATNATVAQLWAQSRAHQRAEVARGGGVVSAKRGSDDKARAEKARVAEG